MPAATCALADRFLLVTNSYRMCGGPLYAPLTAGKTAFCLKNVPGRPRRGRPPSGPYQHPGTRQCRLLPPDRLSCSRAA